MPQTLSQAPVANKTFLPQIGGLRGIAILLIVLYHLNPDWCCRGYFGVDVFLVISGYLIYSSYLARQKTTTLLSFCKGRFTRLFPPVLAMLLVYHIVSAALLDPREWQEYSFSAVTALLGYANVYFDSSMKNYFAEDAARYPLLHLWYLSVIIHFYLLFAVVFIVLKKVPCALRWIFLLVLALVSLYMFKFWQVPYRFVYRLLDDPLSQPPVSAYYWTIGRFWECIAGMLIVYMPKFRNNGLRSLLTIIGIIGVVLPAFYPLRGAQQNMFAIAGTMCIIAYAPTGFAARLLNNTLLQFFGKISFSLYLWHAFVFNIWKHYTYWELTSREQYIYMFGAAIILSYGAWYLVEKRKFTFKATTIWWILTLALTYGIAKINFTDYFRKDLQYQVNSTHEYRSLIGTPYEYLNTEASFQTWSGAGFAPKNRLSFLGDTSKAPTFLMMGDSHAFALMHGINIVGKENGFAGVFAVSRPLPLCQSDFSLNKPIHHQTMTEQVINYLATRPELTTVLATCRWGDEYTHYDNNPELATRRFCEEIRKLGKKLVLITDNPSLKEGRVSWYATFCRINGIKPRPEAVECTEKEYYAYNGRAIAALEQLEKEGLCHLVRIEPHLFQNGIFKAVRDDKTLFMFDKDHITHDASIWFARKMKEPLCRFLK